METVDVNLEEPNEESHPIVFAGTGIVDPLQTDSPDTSGQLEDGNVLVYSFGFSSMALYLNILELSCNQTVYP